ncbi:GNAT family N-acetyltransferase [Vallicoccus soli]|uniref:GNAT family N-acetyltransferase n=1 Tax=Vallicoccus soli TaxID=2339232 RepID=A0A3A3Z883_9ACTN|nr:N-acetyltransferase [Vallicoccus soli]RJK98117.1 GNAT family N-acetyltransferase [Vallicoccus soli]
MSAEHAPPASPHGDAPHPGPVLVRPARADDLAAVDAVTTRTYLDEGFTPPDSPYVAELASGARRAAQAQLLVAELPGPPRRLAGSVTLGVHGSPWAEVARPGEAELRMLAVDPAARGAGTGSALVAEAASRARALGCAALVLSTQRSMAAAHRLYARSGFRRVPERDWSPVPGLVLEVWRLDLRA